MASAGSAKNVKLAPAAGVDLAAHVNHQIEVDRRVERGSRRRRRGRRRGRAKSKTFSVDAAKMIAASCTTGTN